MGQRGPDQTTNERTAPQGEAVRPADARVASAGTKAGEVAATGSSDAEVSAFIAKMKAMSPATTAGRGRLVFAMDATMSRQPTWDMALGLQSTMFDTVGEIGGLDVQLVYYRGNGECAASKWVSDAASLARLMTTVSCRGGHTQIGKVLLHALRETEKRRVQALVFVGDAMEENPDDLCARAGDLALHGVPVFLFQEGREARAEATFREIARITHGAACRFDAGSAQQLKDLLAAVAAYASGGRAALDALARLGRPGARLLIERMR